MKKTYCELAQVILFACVKSLLHKVRACFEYYVCLAYCNDTFLIFTKLIYIYNDLSITNSQYPKQFLYFIICQHLRKGLAQPTKIYWHVIIISNVDTVNILQ